VLGLVVPFWCLARSVILRAGLAWHPVDSAGQLRIGPGNGTLDTGP